MLYTKETTTGLDFYIQRLQSYLYDETAKLWTVDGEAPAHEAYGRCYRNPTKEGIVAEVYIGGEEYKEVYWNDEVAAVSFFGHEPLLLNHILQKVKCHLVVFCNLAKLKPGLSAQRADEEVRLDYQRILGKAMYGFHPTSIEVGLDNVLREYKGSAASARLKYKDMQPLHCFRINFLLSYNPSQTQLKLS